MHVRIEVPATLSNLGSGYDTLGLAVGLRNGFELAEGPWSLGDRRVDPSADLVLATARQVALRYGGREVPLALTVDERVPRSRGLGSSATARVAGLLAGITAVEAEVPLAERLRWLAEAEGHPDNVWPALLGGLVVCGRTARAAPLHADVRIAVAIPDREVSTPLARRALPAGVAHADAVHNLGALATLLVGLSTGDPDALREGVSDRLHQPWRIPLIGPVDEAFAGAREAGGAPFVSGSGSTLAAFTVGAVDAAAVAEALARPFRARGVACRAEVLEASVCGATLADLRGSRAS